MRKFLDNTAYLPYLLIHPFQGFHEARFRDKGNVLLAAILFVLYGLAQIFAAQYTGFVANFAHPLGIWSTELFISGALPVVLFLISNYSVTTLMNGNARFRDIFIVTCYSLTPLIFFSVLTAIISNVLIIEEIPLLLGFYWIGIVWFLFLLFAGLCVAHEYTVFQNIAALFLSLVAACIILFLCMLFIILWDRVVNFFGVVIFEIIERLRP